MPVVFLFLAFEQSPPCVVHTYPLCGPGFQRPSRFQVCHIAAHAVICVHLKKPALILIKKKKPFYTQHIISTASPQDLCAKTFLDLLFDQEVLYIYITFYYIYSYIYDILFIFYSDDSQHAC